MAVKISSCMCLHCGKILSPDENVILISPAKVVGHYVRFNSGKKFILHKVCWKELTAITSYYFIKIGDIRVIKEDKTQLSATIKITDIQRNGKVTGKLENDPNIIISGEII